MVSKSLDVSLVTANYNNSKYLDEFFYSLLNSEYHPKEIIFVDDASLDNSVIIAKKYLKLFKQHRIIELKKNIGLPAALNIGIKEVSCKYIMRIDPDDFVTKNRIVKQYVFLNKRPEVSLCGSNVYYFNDYLKKVRFRSNFPELSQDIYNNFRSGDYGLSHNSVMGRTELFKNYPYNIHAYPAEDYELFARMVKDKITLINLSDALTYYRIHSNNISQKMSKELYNKVFKYQKIFFNVNIPSIKKKRIYKHFYFYRKGLADENKIKSFFHFFIAILFRPEKIKYLEIYFKNICTQRVKNIF